MFSFIRPDRIVAKLRVEANCLFLDLEFFIDCEMFFFFLLNLKEDALDTWLALLNYFMKTKSLLDLLIINNCTSFIYDHLFVPQLKNYLGGMWYVEKEG